MARRARRKSRTLGCLVWFVMILVVAIAFLVARPSIIRAAETSGLADVFRRAPVVTQSVDATRGEGAADTPRADPEQAPAVIVDTVAEPAREPESSTTPDPTSRTAPEQTSPQEAEEPRGTGPTPQETTPPRSRRSSTLYFVKQDDAGVSLSGLPREVTYTDAPLTETLVALVEGPSATERSKGYLSLIPEGTRVESVEVRGETAYVSFDERFRVNPYGRDGLEAQLKQVVWTATEFGSVRSVQILIGGRIADYLGPEGLRIRDPLSRESMETL